MLRTKKLTFDCFKKITILSKKIKMQLSTKMVDKSAVVREVLLETESVFLKSGQDIGNLNSVDGSPLRHIRFH